MVRIENAEENGLQEPNALAAPDTRQIVPNPGIRVEKIACDEPSRLGSIDTMAQHLPLLHRNVDENRSRLHKERSTTA